MVYPRSRQLSKKDFLNAREYEDQVAQSFVDHGAEVNTNLNSSTKPDFEVGVGLTHFWVDLKEKRQHISNKWPSLPNVSDEQRFIFSEKEVLKYSDLFPHVYYLLHDVPRDRLYVAGIWEVFAVHRKRVEREGATKWIVNLDDFHQVSAETDLIDFARQCDDEMPWNRKKAMEHLEDEEI